MITTSLDKYNFLKVLLFLCALDALSIWLLIFFYLSGIDIMFIVNINFVVILGVLTVFALTSLRITKLSILFWLLVFVALVKALIYVEGEQSFGMKFLFSYGFSLIMPLLALNFAGAFNISDYPRVLHIFKRFALVYAVIAISGVLVYSFFYFIGKIAYFGMGSNMHYIFPFFLDANKLRNTVIFFIVIVLSGKRAVLMNFVAQNLVHYSSFLFRRPMYVVAMFGITVTAAVLVYQHTSYLDRFEVFFNLDFNDERALMLAFSGRMEELFGIFQYFSNHPNQIYFGAPAGASYQWVVEMSEHVEAKNYAHVTVFGYVFRYGIVFAIAIYGSLITILLRRWAPSEPFFLAVFGILVSSLFGANLVVDPLSWLFIGFLVHICMKKKDRKRLEKAAKYRLHVEQQQGS